MASARVLFLRSNPIDPDPRVEKEAETLAGAGYEVAVLGWDRSGALPVEERRRGGCGEYTVYRLPIKAGFGRGMMNLPQLLRWQAGLLFWLLKHRRAYDILHACDFDTILPALICKLLFGKKVVYDIFDYYADHLRATPQPVLEVIRRVDLWAVDRADGVILVDDARRVQIDKAHPRRLEVVYNTPADVTVLDREGIPGAREEESLSLAYIGLLQVERGLLELVSLLKAHPEWSLDLAGFGGDSEQILSAVRDLPNVRFHGRISYDRTLALSAAADILFATYDPAIPNHRLSSPNKLFEAMLLGKPIIVARGTNMDRIVEAAECGIVVEYGDVPELEAALQKLASDPDYRLRLGANARKAYESTYSWELMQARLLRLYRNVWEGGPVG